MIYTSFKTMVDTGAEVINNSWGTNIHINMLQTPNYPYGLPAGVGPLDGRGDADVKSIDNGNVGNMAWINNVPQAEYEYFYWKKVYGDTPSFVDGAYDAVKDTDVVYVMTTGNRDNASPFHRALYPYFHPEAERHWIAAAGIQKQPDGKLSLITNYNEAGLAKWWTMTGYSLTDAFTTNVNGDNLYGTQ